MGGLGRDYRRSDRSLLPLLVSAIEPKPSPSQSTVLTAPVASPRADAERWAMPRTAVQAGYLDHRTRLPYHLARALREP